MKLGIMQPYFFPYLGYFSLIDRTDKWIVFDTAQYIYHGWVNRNRILHPSREQWQYVIVPLAKHPREANINEIRISGTTDWRKRIIAQMDHYKKKAPFFKETIELVEECFSGDVDFISKLNVHILSVICRKLGIKFDYEVFSEMDLGISGNPEPGEWALKISEKLGADEYINPPGGREIFDTEKFNKAGIKLSFLTINNVTYNQFNKEFIPGLSILDILMFNDAETIRKFLNNSEITN